MRIKNNIQPKTRRGLSSIVGALIFVVLMVATFSVLGVALNSQTEIVDTNRQVADTNLKKQQEKFTLNNVIQLPGNFLQVNLTNQGQNSAEMFTLIMTNKTDPNLPTKKFDIPGATSFLAPGDDDQTNIVSTLDLTMDIPVSGSEFYEAKVISSLGTIKKLTIECKTSGICGPSVPTVGSGALQTQLFLDGPNGINTKTSTVVMFVQNTGSTSVYNVSPTRTCAAMTTVLIGTGTFDPCPLDSPDPFSELLPGSTAIFKWDGIVNAEIDDVFKFENAGGGFADAGLTTPVPDSNLDFDLLTVIDPNDCGGCDEGDEGGETIILIDDLLIKPSLFLTIPSPYGSVPSGSAEDHVGVWGVQVANPLNFTIGISKVTITAFAPGANSNLKIFDPAGDNENISPGTPGLGMGSWITNAENVLVWKNFTSPIILGPYQSESFMTKIKPWSNGVDLEAIIVQTSIFSTSGSFGKAAYQTTMFPAGGANDAPIANVFMSRVVDSRDTADIYGHRNNLVNGSSQEFIMVMADMDDNPGSYIAAGSEFIINVPREWANVVVDPDILKTTNIECCNSTHPSIVTHSDDSIQIIGHLKYDIGTGGKNTATITFTVDAPEKRDERLYIMHVLGNGIDNSGDNSVGPLSEIILHVIGNVTGYP